MATKYLLHGKITAKPGHVDTLRDILLQAAQLLSQVKGCHIYAVSKDPADENSVYVTEVWDSKEDHDHSLQDKNVRALIMKAMPIIDGMPQRGQELEVMGGLGV